MQNHNNAQPPAELDVFITDLNGQQRGKRVTADSLDKLLKEGFKLPRSVMGLDCWGDDVVKNGLVFETGDSDGLCQLVSKQPIPMPWCAGTQSQIIATMYNDDGSPFLGDPRQILAGVLERYAAKGLRPVLAAELEFYLFDQASIQANKPIASPHLAQHQIERPDAYAIRDLDAFRALLNDLRHACQLQNIPADAMIAEFGNGQFEVNLKHHDNALLAADQTVLFKRLVKGVAAAHGHVASFMAKPFGDKSGCGFHLHFSVLDEKGSNIFANGSPKGSEALRYAVAGLLQTMPDAMLLFAPHLNSWRRLQPGSHAPTQACWGYENRTVAIRIPDSPDVARRIEHRVAGADANPYLVIAAILAAALYGIEQRLEPPAPITGNAYEQGAVSNALPRSWLEALEGFRHSTLLPELLGDVLIPVLSAAKTQEMEKFNAWVSNVEYETYLKYA